MSVLVADTIHPHYKAVINTILLQQDIKIEYIPFSKEEGVLDKEALQLLARNKYAAWVIQQPNFFGQLEDVDSFTDLAHQQEALCIASVNPISVALVKPPGEWGFNGADIACGEGQPLGIPLASGGPYCGFLSAKKKWVRQMPGRIVGKTVDDKSNEAYTLTLQAREQHIRRSKATSNICTNQGLLVVVTSIYLSIMGPLGLKKVALKCHQNASYLLAQLKKIDGISVRFKGPFFHEFVISLKQSADNILKALAQDKIAGGFDLGAVYSDMGTDLLLCVTETKTKEQMDEFVMMLQKYL